MLQSKYPAGLKANAGFCYNTFLSLNPYVYRNTSVNATYAGEKKDPVYNTRCHPKKQKSQEVTSAFSWFRLSSTPCFGLLKLRKRSRMAVV
jgi:hypothetical protein